MSKLYKFTYNDRTNKIKIEEFEIIKETEKTYTLANSIQRVSKSKMNRVEEWWSNRPYYMLEKDIEKYKHSIIERLEYENTLSERNIQITTNFENKEINNRNELIERIKGAVND